MLLFALQHQTIPQIISLFCRLLHKVAEHKNRKMATPAVHPRPIRTELVMRNQDYNAATLKPVLLSNNLKQPAVKECSVITMSEQEAEIFFAVCENPSPAPIEMFSRVNVVSKWFKN